MNKYNFTQTLHRLYKPLFKSLILLLLSFNTLFAMDAKEAHKLSEKNENKKVEGCVKTAINTLEYQIVDNAKLGGYVTCTPNECLDQEDQVFNRILVHFTPRGFKIYVELSEMCVSWKEVK